MPGRDALVETAKTARREPRGFCFKRPEKGERTGGWRASDPNPQCGPTGAGRPYGGYLSLIEQLVEGRPR